MTMSRETQGNLTERAEIGMEPAAGRGLDGPDEAARQHDIARRQALPAGRQPEDPPSPDPRQTPTPVRTTTGVPVPPTTQQLLDLLEALQALDLRDP